MIDAIAEKSTNQHREGASMQNVTLENLPPVKQRENRLSDDVDKMLVIYSLLERIDPSPAPADAKSGYPADMIRHSFNEAYGYSDAESRYQPTPEDISVRDALEPLLAEAKRTLDPVAVSCLFLRYRIGHGGIADETELMPWHLVASVVKVKTAERAVGYADEVVAWLQARF